MAMKTFLRPLIVQSLAACVVTSAGLALPRAGLVSCDGSDDPSSTPASDDLAVIVNSGNPTASLSVAQLRGIFLAERAHWPNGQKITVVMREEGEPERSFVLKLICRMSESDFARHLLHANFTGQVQAGPKLLNSAAGVRKFVFSVPGAIGYVRASELDGSIRTVRIDDRLPGEADYKLRFPPR